MKKLFTILLVSALAINTSFAQPGQGTWILGATTDAASPNGWSNIALQPTIGYFLNDQFVLGLGLNYSSASQEIGDQFGFDADNAKSIQSGMIIAPWARIYTNERFFIHAGLSIGSGSDKLTVSGDLADAGAEGSEDKNASFGFDVGPGFSLMWGEYVAIEPAMLISMTSGSTTPDGGDKIKDPTIFNVGFRIGVAIMLSE